MKAGGTELTTVYYLNARKNLHTINTKGIAEKLVSYCKQGDFETPYQELYSPDIISIENEGKVENAHVQGMGGIQKKGEWWAVILERPPMHSHRNRSELGR